jgi:PAS domain S-box-containing protein
MPQSGRLDHRKRDVSVRCCEFQVHQLKFGNVKGELMTSQNIVFPVGSESVKRSLKSGLPVPELSHAMQSRVGVNLDIQENKLAEFYLAEELRQILDFVPQLVSVYGPNRERLHINGIALDYLGLSLEEWRQTPESGAFVHPDDRGQEQEYFDRAVSTGSAYELELRLRRGDGSYRWFLARSNPVCDDKGQIIRWYVACTDIDDRKTAEERLRQENVALREEIDKASMFEEIVGASPTLMAALSRACKVAVSESTVLITGETGTGKELVARAIHRRSRRASRAFVAVNCAAIPRDLISSELFGHEKGVYRGRTAATRSVRAGERRHDLPRRGGRTVVRDTGAVAARPAREGIRTRGRARADPGRCSRNRRNES